MLDRLNQEIKVGSIIAYGHALGRCAGLRIGKVLKVTENKPTSSWDDGNRISVMGVDDDWNSKKPQLCARKGTLMFPDRTIVLDEKMVPELYMNLLREVK